MAREAYTRRRFLEKGGVAGAGVLGGTLWATAPAAARARRNGKPRTPLKHIIVSCQENRSFDHYYGFAPQVQRRGFGPPPGYSQPDASGAPHPPVEFTALSTPDPPHSWTAVHRQ